jgi:hypothetical protein
MSQISSSLTNSWHSSPSSARPCVQTPTYGHLTSNFYAHFTRKTPGSFERLQTCALIINRPTDTDICQYFEHCWPDVTIATPLDEDAKSAFIWGFMYVGVEAADDNVVYINGLLATHWLIMDAICFPFMSSTSFTTNPPFRKHPASQYTK